VIAWSQWISAWRLLLIPAVLVAEVVGSLRRGEPLMGKPDEPAQGM
jgi:hypothetical protein